MSRRELRNSAEALSSATQIRVSVFVAGRKWRRLASLSDLLSAKRTANVYAIDTDAGTVVFGDGVRGARPPHGARIVVKYRTSSAGSGAIRSAQTHCP